MILKLALILILFGIIFVSAALGKKLDEMNDCITETHRMTMELKAKIEKLEKEKLNDRIMQTHKMALELRDKIEKLEKEKTNDHSQS